MSMEVEIKLACPADELQRVLEHPAVTARCLGREEQQLRSVYYDTPERLVWRRRLTLRVRGVDGRFVQTVKGEGAAGGGLHERRESSAEVSGWMPEAGEIVDADLRAALDEQALLELAPAFETEVSRTLCVLGFPDGTEAELAADRGKVAAAGRSAPLSEVEIELRSGGLRPLFELAMRLCADLPLRPDGRSKAERGYALAAGERPAPVKSRLPRLAAGMPAGEAFRAVIAGCLEQFHANLEGVLEGEDPEYVHQARVALRRMRSALALFSALIPRERLDAVRAEAGVLASALGPAREWDVFGTETLPPLLAQFPGHAGLEALAAAAAEARDEANAMARAALDSARGRRIMMGLSAWLAVQPWREPHDPSLTAALAGPIGGAAAAMLRRRHRSVEKRGRQLESLGTDELHALRIAVKKLRYACEFFGGLFPEKRTRRYRERTEDLQEHLGALNDGATVDRLLQGLALGDGPAIVEARALLRGFVAASALGHRQALGQAWQRFLDARPPFPGHS